MSWFKAKPMLTAENKRAVQWVAECLAYHCDKDISKWRNYEIEARHAIVAHVAIRMVEDGVVDLADVQLSE